MKFQIRVACLSLCMENIKDQRKNVTCYKPFSSSVKSDSDADEVVGRIWLGVVWEAMPDGPGSSAVSTSTMSTSDESQSGH